ncbi:MAG: hypothetical protein WC455_12160 [Dehalococcoidia bacterium]|jgi:hypothetical protein
MAAEVTASTTALVTLDEEKIFLQLALDNNKEDTILQDLINGVSESVVKYMKRDLISTAHTELRDGNGRNTMWLLHWPIIDATAGGTDPVLMLDDDGDDTWEAASTYAITLKWDKITGEIWLKDKDVFPKGQRNLKFVYTAGYATSASIPADIKLGVKKLVGIYREEMSGGKLGVRSISIANEATTYDFGTWPADIRAIFDRNRRIDL